LKTNEVLLFTDADSWMTDINRNLGQTGPAGQARPATADRPQAGWTLGGEAAKAVNRFPI
jgi:hypothetical protein